MSRVVDIKLQPKQLAAAEYWLDDTTEELTFGGAKGGAKSYLGCALIFSDALVYPNTQYFIARQNLNDLTKYTMSSVSEVLEHMGIEQQQYCRFNGQQNNYELYNGSKVFFIDCKYLPSDPDYHRFGSLQFTRGWFEEVGQINTNAIINLSASVGRWKNSDYNLKRKILLTCNPYKGYAYTTFYLPNKRGDMPSYRKFVQSLPTDNKYLTEDYLRALSRLPENERRRLMEGDWEYDNDPTSMISGEAIADLFTNIHAPVGQKYIIGDIARFGSDRAIIAVWDGFKIIEYVALDKSSIADIRNVINALRIKYGIPVSNVLVDEDGVGGGVVDVVGCKGFTNNGRPFNKNYQNIKSECGYKLAEQIDKIWIECPLPEKEKEMIIQEMAMLKTFDTDKDGKLRILPKEKIKEIIGRSPDWLDMFIMRMYYEVRPNISFSAVGVA